MNSQLLPGINPFSEFIRLNHTARIELLRKKGILLDTDVIKDTQINLYFLDGFFIEETVNRNNNQVEEVLPFKRGYRLQSYLKGGLQNRDNFSLN